jgi:hypothetical protein
MEVVGELKVVTAGTYTFKLSSDDGSKVLIGGSQVTAMWRSQGLASSTGTKTLAAGTHDIYAL